MKESGKKTPPPSPLKGGASSPFIKGTKVAEDSAGNQRPAAIPQGFDYCRKEQMIGARTL